MIPRPPNPLAQATERYSDCPPLIDLAALSDGRVTGEALERLEAHLAGCERCLALVRGLRTEMRESDEAARLTLVPAHVLRSAMSLRKRDGEISGSDLTTAQHAGGAHPWMLSARRGFAAAAMLGIVVGGYYVGQSFNNIGPQQAGDVAANNALDDGNVTFGLLGTTTGSAGTVTPEDDDDGFGLFVLTAREGQS